jgi:regulator of sirC expression with transglutaminase-like and TPR domain
MKRLLPALVAAVALSLPAAAQTIDGPQEYRTCLVLAKTKPEQGWEEALAWQSLGGGEAARHCAAVALIGLGKYGEAAARLETLANESVREDGVRAQMLAQAGQAWMLAGKLPRADSAQRAALVLAPSDPDILLDHAVLLAQVHHYAEAIDLLSGLLRRQPNRVEALVLRASAFRYQDNLPGAADDVEQALKLDPDYPDALLERGMIRRLRGDDAAARDDWRRAVELAPDSDAAETARRNLEKLDVKVK